jgi:hypothetical protein
MPYKKSTRASILASQFPEFNSDQYKKSLAISHGFKYFYIFSNDSIDDIKAVITKLNIALNRS